MTLGYWRYIMFYYYYNHYYYYYHYCYFLVNNLRSLINLEN